MQAVHEGAQDYLVGREVDGSLLGRSIPYAIERMRSELELARLAFYDPLTRLPNHKLLVDRLGLALAGAERSGRLAALLFLDLDRFKLVNESLGHEVGDGLLRQVARRLTELVRPSDTVARLGGDEFMVLCPDLGAEREAVLVAERLSGGLAEAHLVEGFELYVGVSIGIAFWPLPSQPRGHDPGCRPDDVPRQGKGQPVRAVRAPGQASPGVAARPRD